MTIATEKIKPSSHRFDLVRITAKRHVSLDFALVNSLYVATMDYTFAFSSLERNGSSASLTRVYATPANNDEYMIDEEAGTITLKAANAPDESSYQYVLFHHIFLTSGTGRRAYETPTDTGASQRFWEPRLNEPSTIRQTIENFETALFTFGNTSVKVASADHWFQRYLSTKDSLFNSSIIIWQCINGTDNIQMAFKGRVVSVRFDVESVTLDCHDEMFALQDSAYCGDSIDECFHSGSYPGTETIPIPLIMAPRSFEEHQPVYAVALNAANSGLWPYKGIRAYPQTFTDTPTTSVNRTWNVCRIRGSVPMQSFGTIQATNGTGSYTVARFSSYSNLYVGDSISYVDSGTATTRYAKIIAVGSFTWIGDGQTYNVAIDASFGGAGSFTTTDTMVPLHAMSVIVLADGSASTVAKVHENADFTITETATTGGNTLVQITFDNNFESGYTIGTLTPQTDEVYCAVADDADASPGAVLKYLAEAAGLDTDASTFTDVDSALATDQTGFQIPYKDSSEYKSFYAYIADLLASILGYMRLNSDGAAEAYLLAAPSSTIVRDDNQVFGGWSGKIDYGDTYSALMPENPHMQKGLLAPSTVTTTSTHASYLHGVNKTKNMTFLLYHKVVSAFVNEFSPDRAQSIIDYLARRRLTYEIGTASEDIDTALGDDLQLELPGLAGGVSSQDVKVMAISKSVDETRLTVSDVLGL